MQMFVRPVLQRRKIIGADAYNLTLYFVELCDTRLVRGDFPRSTTSKRSREERNHNVLFAAIIGKADVLTV